MKKAIVIGAGFAGISTATTLADQGFEVTILEKNESAGGRARTYKTDGFTFDMGPSWYWMPDVFDSYFKKFGKNTSDYYQLKRLDPSYTVIYGEDEFIDIPANFKELEDLFESLEKGSAKQLRKFLSQAEYKYDAGINDLVYRPGRSLLEFLDLRILTGLFKMDLLQSFYSHVRKFFKNEKILGIMDFPVLFLGAMPEDIPALYSLMNYADIKLGTWYPDGGMHKIVEGMVSLAEEKGVKFLYNHEVESFETQNKKITSVLTQQGTFEADVVIGGADYHHIESKILEKNNRSYSEKYWNSRMMAPSSLIFYLGINKKLQKLNHHNLFFDEDLREHAVEIYQNPQWPEKPLFYVCAPSTTDATVAPEGCENLFILIPVAPGLEDNEEVREKYFDIVLQRLEELTDQEIRSAIVHKRSFAHNDFVKDYHAFKGNAYGLANTLTQTAILKPSLKSKKVKNLYYTGQLTVPGPGVPPSLISGQVVAKEVINDLIKD